MEALNLEVLSDQLTALVNHVRKYREFYPLEALRKNYAANSAPAASERKA